MRIRLLTVLIASAALTFGASYSLRQEGHVHQSAAALRGAIAGRVLDVQGRPVPGAEVMAISDSGSVGIVPTAYTDAQGEFLVNHLAPDVYTLSVAKEADGYPHTHFTVYSDRLTTNVLVTLGEGETISGVTLRLGPKAERVTGRIIDVSTGKPIRGLQDVAIVIKRADGSGDSLSTGPDLRGNFSILVPAAPYTLEVSAPGYERWEKNSEAAGRRAPSARASGVKAKPLTVALRPAH